MTNDQCQSKHDVRDAETVVNMSGHTQQHEESSKDKPRTGDQAVVCSTAEVVLKTIQAVESKIHE